MMKTDVFKKWVALLGGVMMLANVVLPWLTYAEEETGTSSTAGTVETETSSTAGTEGTETSSTAESTAPAPDTEETLKEKFAKAVEEQMDTLNLPEGVEKSYDPETKTVTVTISESAKALTKNDIKWTNWIVALNTILSQENVKTFKMGDQDERDVKQIKNADSSLAALKTIILADAGNEIIAQWAPNLKNLGQFIGKTLKVAVSYGIGTVSVNDSFSFKFVEKEVEFEKKGDQHFFFTKDEAVAYFQTLVWEEKANAWGSLLSKTNPVIALVYEVKNAGEKKEIVLNSDVKARPEWLEWVKNPENQKNNNDSADENGNLVMKASFDADEINGYHAFFLSPGDQIDADFSEGNFTLTVGEKVLTYNVKKPQLSFEKVGEKNYFFSADEAIAYFKTVEGLKEKNFDSLKAVLSKDKPVIALVYTIKDASEDQEVTLTSDLKVKEGWLKNKPAEDNDSADEKGNLVMKSTFKKTGTYGFFFLSPGDQIDADFSEGNFTLTVGEKVLTYNVKKVADLEWKTDYDPSKSSNEEVRTHYVVRPGTPFVDVKEGMKLDGTNPSTYQHLMFLYKVNNLAWAEKVRYEIRLNDAQGDVIAYGSRSSVTEVDGFYWSLRDWRADPQFKADEIANYVGGPAGLTVVEARNDDILKAGTKVVFIVKVKYAAGEQTIEYPYTITAQDVINATIGEKVTLTLMDGDKEIGKQAVLSGTVAQKPADPKKEKNTFKGWFTDKELTKAFDFATELDKDTTLYAKWEAVKPSSSGSSSGGGGGGSSYSPSKKTTTKTDQTTTPKTSDTPKATDAKSLEALTKEFVEANKADTQKVEALAKALTSVKNSLVAQELKDAYTYAYLRGITTQPSIEKAQLQRGLTRAEMAKMMSVFAMNVLGKKVVKTDAVQYADVEGMEWDLPGFIQLAYQLQIMGIDAKGNALPSFNPNAEVTRAEFATVLSRVLYGDTYNTEGADWAAKHLEALKSAGILKSTQSDLKELRGWVMLMLQRAEGVK